MTDLVSAMTATGGMLYLKYCIEQIKVSLKEWSTQIFDFTSANIILLKAKQKAKFETILYSLLIVSKQSYSEEYFLY